MAAAGTASGGYARARRVLWWLGAPARLLLLAVIRVYRLVLSPALAGLGGSACRFDPSCSVYAEEAVARHGAVRGSLLAAWRLLRCSPLTRGGLDPVPAPRRMSYDAVIHAAEAEEAAA